MTNLRIEKLTRHHGVDGFDCGQEALNRFLSRFALANQQTNAFQTYAALADDAVIGFYTLVVGEASYHDAPERLVKGPARHPGPLTVLARMGVSRNLQGKGVGAGLLKDAMLRTLQAADIAGIRAFAAHAKDEQARAFYRRFDFIASPTDPLHLLVLIKDLKRASGLA